MKRNQIQNIYSNGLSTFAIPSQDRTRQESAFRKTFRAAMTGVTLRYFGYVLNNLLWRQIRINVLPLHHAERVLSFSKNKN